MLDNRHSINKLKPKFFFKPTETVGVGEIDFSQKVQTKPEKFNVTNRVSQSFENAPIESKYINAWDTFSSNRLKYDHLNSNQKRHNENFQASASDRNLSMKNFSKVQQKMIDFEKSEKNISDKYQLEKELNSNRELPSNLKDFYNKYNILTSDRVRTQENCYTSRVNSNNKVYNSYDTNNHSDSNYNSLVDIRSRFEKAINEGHNTKSGVMSNRNLAEKSDTNIKQILQETQRTDDQVLRDFFDYKIQGISELNNLLSDRNCKEKNSLENSISQIKKDTKHLQHLKDQFTKKNAVAKKHNESQRSSTIQRNGDLNFKFIELEREWKEQVNIGNEDVRRRMEEFENGLLEIKKNNHQAEVRTLEGYKVKNENLKDGITKKSEILSSIKAEYEEMRSENETVVSKIRSEIAPSKKHIANYEQSQRKTEENILEKLKRFYDFKAILEAEVFENHDIESKLTKLHKNDIFKEKSHLKKEVSINELQTTGGAELLRVSYNFDSILQASLTEENGYDQMLSDTQYTKNCIEEIDENEFQD